MTEIFFWNLPHSLILDFLNFHVFCMGGGGGNIFLCQGLPTALRHVNRIAYTSACWNPCSATSFVRPDSFYYCKHVCWLNVFWPIACSVTANWHITAIIISLIKVRKVLSAVFFSLDGWNKAVFYSKNTSFVSEIPQNHHKIVKIIIFHPILGV